MRLLFPWPHLRAGAGATQDLCSENKVAALTAPSRFVVVDADGYQEIALEIEGVVVPLRCWLAADGASRRKGLSGSDSLPEDGALLIPGAPIVHMVGMKFPLDLVFISPSRKIVKVRSGAKPGLGLYGSPRSWYCLEMNSGAAARIGMRRGSKVSWTGAGRTA